MDDINAKLTKEDVAYILGVTRTTIYNRQAAGDLPNDDGLAIVKAEIKNKEEEIKNIRQRLREKLTERVLYEFT